MRLVQVTVAAGMLFAVAGCGLFESEPDYFPTSVGSSWRYEAEMVLNQSDAGADTLWTQVTNLRVAGTAVLGGGKQAAVFVTVDSFRQRMPHDTLIMTSDTSWILKNSSWVLDFDGPNDDRPDTMLALPLEQDKTWQVYARADTALWATVTGREDITVPAGTYANCLEVEYEYSFSGGNYKLTHWYAEETGWVRGRSSFSAGGYTGITEQRLTGCDIK
ncbi:MAG: hypothetical protein R6X14_04850 [bacterium]